MLGTVLITEASEDLSTDIMKDFNQRLSNFRVNKRDSNWQKLSKDILTKEGREYSFLGKSYKVEFGEVNHKNGIGNNNEWPIFLASEGEKCLVGYFFVLWPIFGDSCTAHVETIGRSRI